MLKRQGGLPSNFEKLACKPLAGYYSMSRKVPMDDEVGGLLVPRSREELAPSLLFSDTIFLFASLFGLSLRHRI